MKLKVLGANRTVVTMSGREVFYSYNTPVVVCIDGKGYFRTSQRFSVTTSKHIGQYLKGIKATEVPQGEIEAMAEGKG